MSYNGKVSFERAEQQEEPTTDNYHHHHNNNINDSESLLSECRQVEFLESINEEPKPERKKVSFLANKNRGWWRGSFFVFIWKKPQKQLIMILWP